MRLYLFTAVILLISACNNPEPEKSIADNSTTPAEKVSFFPVTSYIKGQIFEINERKLTPIKYTIINNHTDSFFVKFEQLDSLLTEFLHPVIDSTSLTPFFTETRFNDQTIKLHFIYSYHLIIV